MPFQNPHVLSTDLMQRIKEERKLSAAGDVPELDEVYICDVYFIDHCSYTFGLYFKYRYKAVTIRNVRYLRH